jgi:ubiquinone/menaquinone biosynthesis C-methylase UbiE
MADITNWLYRFYWTIERRIVPGLRNSQYEYFDEVNSRVTAETSWLDLGCGNHLFGGWMRKEQAEVMSRCRNLAGIDLNHSSLLKHSALRNKVEGNLEHLPFRDASFDLVTTNMVVEHLETPCTVLSEVRRVLKPNGVLVFHTPNYHNPAFQVALRTPESIKRILIRFFEQRGPEDTFPTFYRLNTPSQIQTFLEGSGLRLLQLRLVNSSALTVMLGPLVVFELLILRLLSRPKLAIFRPNIVAIARKG